MRLFDLIAVLIVLSAAFSFVNIRLLKLPPAIGLMALSLLFSIGVVVVGRINPDLATRARSLASEFDFDQALLHGMLGFLLFAGALRVNLSDLSSQALPVAILATVGVLLSTAIVGGLTWLAMRWIGLAMRPVDCLLFGALISPTDPIAVLSLLKQIGAPKALEVQIAGESLFNDGVGVVVFTALLAFASEKQAPEFSDIGMLFLRESGGGIAFGLAVGLVAYAMLHSVDDYAVEILISLALVAGGSALADTLEVSGPIAMVVAGLLIGNHGRSFAMSETTRKHLDMFWELIDETLNAMLFVLIGLVVLSPEFKTRDLPVGLLAVAIVLTARLVSVSLPAAILGRWRGFVPTSVLVLTWGGLRGGISVALALSLPSQGEAAVPSRDVILEITYVVVVFSILVQGLSIGPLTGRWLARSRARGEPSPELFEE